MPNAITLLRVILVPIAAYFVIISEDIYAIIAVIICSVSDFLDGFLARKLGQVTKFGKVLDPMADRLLIFAILLALTFRHFIPIWCVLAVILRELLLLFQYGQLVLRGLEPIAVKMIGKIGAAGLMISMPLLFFLRSPKILNISYIANPLLLCAFVILGASIVVYWVAGIEYCNAAAKILVKHPNKRGILISSIVTALVAIAITAILLVTLPGGLSLV